MVPLSPRLTFCASCALFILFAAAAPLSQAASTGQEKVPAGAAAPAGKDELTVIGCVVRLDRSARRPGTSDPIPAGHPGQPASSGYALKDARVSTGDEPKTGPVDTRSDREFGIAKGKVSVERYAGHQVVIKGRLTSTAPASGPAPDSKQPSPGHDAMIDVTAVRTLNDSCPPRD